MRYCVVGGIAYVVDFGLLFSLTGIFHIYYLTSASIGFLSGLTVNYTLSTAWVFTKCTLGNKWQELLIFALIGIAGLGFNQLFIWFLTEKAHLYYLVSKIVSTVAVFLWNFFARKYILFR